MAQVLQFLLSLDDTPLPTFLVLGGIFFLFISIAQVKIFIVNQDNKKTAAKWGTRLLFLGIILFLVPPLATALTPVPPPTPVAETPSTVPSSSTSPPTFTLTPMETFTPAPSATSTFTPTFTIAPSPTQSCDQLRTEDFKITSPAGTHGPETDGSKVPQLKEHFPITWEPSSCPLTITVFTGSVPVRTYESKLSGEITTEFLMQDYPSFVSGAWIEIKVWIAKASLPSDNVHIKLP